MIRRFLPFLSTLSLRRATKFRSVVKRNAFISIHALLAESDSLTTSFTRGSCRFLSTLSLRRATSQQPAGTTRTTYFYPRSPCGERQPAERHANSQQEFLSTLSLRRATIIDRLFADLRFISIHALLAESDAALLPTDGLFFLFLSTLSLRRATSSIDDLEPSTTHFYPRSPCGERR